MIGGSGMAGGWIHNFTTNFSDRIQIIGLADVNTDVLATQGEALGLSTSQLFTDFNEACAEVKADFCGVATPTPISQSGSNRLLWKTGCLLSAKNRSRIPWTQRRRWYTPHRKPDYRAQLSKTIVTPITNKN